MSDDLLSLQAIVVSPSSEQRDLLRQAAAAATLPIEIIETDGAAAACRSLTGGIDLVLLDAALASEEVGRVVAAARAAAKPPFTVLLADAADAAPFPTDGLAAKPSRLAHADLLMESVPRARLPSRVLIVDDSATMRTIVRKIL